MRAAGSQADGADRPRSSRLLLALVASMLTTGAGAGAALHFALAPGSARATSGLPALEGQAVWAAGRVAAPGFTLRDQRGRLVSLSARRGRTLVVAFMDSRCRQICPLEGRVLGRAIAGLPVSSRPELLVVSVDPWADTAASARAAVSRWGLSGRWHWLFGTPRQLARVWRAYRIYVKRTPGDIVHSDAVYVVDRSGYERAGFLFPFLPGPVRHDLAVLARGSAS